MSLLLDVVSGVLLAAGSFFCVTSGLGLIRMPDLFTRAHAASILESLGAGLVFLGLAFQAPSLLVLIKLIFTYFFLMITGLAAVHALAHTVNVAGIHPRLANIVTRLSKNTDSEYPVSADKVTNPDHQPAK